MERIEPSLETRINQASSHVHDDDSITATIITAAFDADRDDVRDLFEALDRYRGSKAEACSTGLQAGRSALGMRPTFLERLSHHTSVIHTRCLCAIP